jgi:small subunit ribosomal protein S8
VKWQTRVRSLELENQVGKIMYTDPIADMLNRIRTAQAVNKQVVEVPYSSLKHAIADCLEKEGFVEKVMKKKKDSGRLFSIGLKYDEEGNPLITEIKRVSSPGQRIYKRAKDLRRIRGGRGVAILSTPKGVMTNNKARELDLGGEVMCEVW